MAHRCVLSEGGILYKIGMALALVYFPMIFVLPVTLDCFSCNVCPVKEKKIH
jgi:hypothetical protein